MSVPVRVPVYVSEAAQVSVKVLAGTCDTVAVNVGADTERRRVSVRVRAGVGLPVTVDAVGALWVGVRVRREALGVGDGETDGWSVAGGDGVWLTDRV